MSEMSDIFKLVNQMELAKKARVGTSLTYFDVIVLLGELNSLYEYIDELESAQRWIPVSERLPECEKDVLVFWGKASDGSKVDWFGTAWRNDSDDGKWCTDPIVPTHWMPLPQPPEVQE